MRARSLIALTYSSGSNPAEQKDATESDPFESRAAIRVDLTPFCVRVTIQMHLPLSNFAQLSCGRSSAREMM
jgi:hypothetical protein